jgi:hypothetical protein
MLRGKTRVELTLQRKGLALLSTTTILVQKVVLLQLMLQYNAPVFIYEHAESAAKLVTQKERF